MTSEYFRSDLTSADFPTHDQPESALIMLRRQIEGRLHWLELTMTPDLGLGRNQAGANLVARGLIDKATFGAVSEVVKAANPVVHGRTVDPAAAATIIETGLQVIAALDSLVEIAQSKIRNLKPVASLLYRFLELPNNRRNRIANSYGVDVPQETPTARVEQARQLLKRVEKSNQLPKLWDEVAQESIRPQMVPNPFRTN